ncbi:MAG TPA: hypothetical protein VLF20_06320 [Patescibacteria group bacterium]|nr:hypothetical protein [Patescibacteria group bacterium]
MKSNHIVDVKKLADGIKFPKSCPNIVLGIYPCRSASTKDLRVFAENGILSIYQLMKSRQRWLMQTPPQDREYFIPKDAKTIFLKETIGYNKEDSQFNPLQILLAAGVPAEKITVFVSMREPIATVTSWLEQFSFNGTTKNELVKNAIIAYKTVDAIVTEARTLHIKVIVNVYESLRDAPANDIYQMIFRKLNLPFSEMSVKNWHLLPPLTNPQSGITFPVEPENFQHTPDHPIHSVVAISHEPKYRKKSIKKIDNELTPQQVKMLTKSNIFNIYDIYRKEASQTLEIPIRESHELKNYYKRHELLTK